MGKIKDIYSQVLSAQVQVAIGADEARYVAFTDAYKPEDKTGFVIHLVEYNFENPLTLQLDSAERYKFGLSFLQVHPTGGMEANDPGVLDHNSISRNDLGTAAMAIFEKNPLVVKDFSSWPGGGLLVHPVNLFAWGYADQAMATQIIQHTIMHYRVIDLTPDLYAELWQSIYIRQV